MPPSLEKPWGFGNWDSLKRSVPPWQHRHFWYHDGTGNKLVIGWRYGFDDGGFEVVCGDIYRCDNMLPALKLWESLKAVTNDRGDGWEKYRGVFIFHGTSRICHPGVYGESFPYPLPDNRWL
jgi:hypothetical protein